MANTIQQSVKWDATCDAFQAKNDLWINSVQIQTNLKIKIKIFRHNERCNTRGNK